MVELYYTIEALRMSKANKKSNWKKTSQDFPTEPKMKLDNSG